MLDKSPRVNAKEAAQNLLGLNMWSAAWTGATSGLRVGNMAYNVARVTGEKDIALVGAGVGAVLSLDPLEIVDEGVNVADMYQKWMNQYADTPTLNTYEAGGNGMYETPVDKDVLTVLNNDRYLYILWKLYNVDQGNRK